MSEQQQTHPVAIGDYRIRSVLGSGGMGMVYRGVSPAGEPVAVKLIHPAALDEVSRQRFSDEVEALKTVFGPRVVSYVDADTEAVEPWLAVQYVPGPSLHDHVESKGSMPPEQVASLGGLLAEGLRSIHEAGLLHRDLKPHNIILGPDGPKVIDFGLATLVATKVDRTESNRLTEPGAMVGTLVCMPPEQVRGEPLSSASDVYALGATLLYAATGHYPFDGETPFALMHAIETPEVSPNVTGLSESLQPVITDLLANRAADRPNLHEVAALLAAVVTAAGLTVSSARERLIAAIGLPASEPLEEPLASRTELTKHRTRVRTVTGSTPSPLAIRMAEHLRHAYAAGAAM